MDKYHTQDHYKVPSRAMELKQYKVLARPLALELKEKDLCLYHNTLLVGFALVFSTLHHKCSQIFMNLAHCKRFYSTSIKRTIEDHQSAK